MVMPMGWSEFHRGPWRLRAVSVIANIPDWNTDGLTSAWIWFVGRQGDYDEWLAHGLTDYMAVDIADQVTETIDGELMDILLTYCGVDWQTIEPLAAHTAALQRQFVNDLDPLLLETLRTLGRSEILALREAEDNVIDKKL